ncbi:MAG: protein kinase [Bryobacteraceae bacterium]
MDHGPLPLAEALRYGIDLAEHLRHVHARRRVFAFLQPACVAIEGGRARLALPKAAGLSPYFSPEQVRGNDLDSRSDLFSLGAILYEMLTGRPAFSATDEAALRGEILWRAPAPLQNFSPALAQLVSHCLEKRPEQRMQRVEVLLAGLKLQYALADAPRPEPLAAVDRREDDAGELAAEEPGAFEPGPVDGTPEPVPLLPNAAETSARQARVAQPAAANPPAAPRGWRAPLFCPRCGSRDPRPSRPQDGFERTLGRFGVSINRCHRCLYRFLYILGVSIGRERFTED